MIPALNAFVDSAARRRVARDLDFSLISLRLICQGRRSARVVRQFRAWFRAPFWSP